MNTSEIQHTVFYCPYCYQPMPESRDAHSWACCGEVGHAYRKTVISGEHGFGYCAHFEDCEGPIAIGYTRQAAIDALLEMEEA